MIFFQLFYTFFFIGAFTFGGGYAMLPLIQDAVLKAGWMSQEEIINFVAVSESTPGPLAINMATFVGMKTAGVLGAICCTLGVVLPSFLIILVVAHFYQKFQKSRLVEGVMSGLKPAVVGLILAALLQVAGEVFFAGSGIGAAMTTLRFWISVVLALVMFVMIRKKVHPILIICASAFFGILAGYALAL